MDFPFKIVFAIADYLFYQHLTTSNEIIPSCNDNLETNDHLCAYPRGQPLVQTVLDRHKHLLEGKIKTSVDVNTFDLQRQINKLNFFKTALYMLLLHGYIPSELSFTVHHYYKSKKERTVFFWTFSSHSKKIYMILTGITLYI